jgi:hypothetical protein
MYRPKISVRWSDHLRTIIGADLFEGSATKGLFGPFSNSSRGTFEIRYYF